MQRVAVLTDGFAHTEASDGSVKADLSVPKAMGGPGKPATTTPEHLFAAGYTPCFGGALDFVAKQKNKDATKAKIVCAVSIGPREGGGFGLASRTRPFRAKFHFEMSAEFRANGLEMAARENLPARAAFFFRWAVGKWLLPRPRQIPLDTDVVVQTACNQGA
jgi:organic hydroperoxide reductase OsmC/OhrA